MISLPMSSSLDFPSENTDTVMVLWMSLTLLEER